VQNIDFAAEESERLQRDYGYLDPAIEELSSEAEAFPGISGDETEAKCMNLIKRMRDEKKRILGIHELEKVPHLRRGQATDQFFFLRADRLEKRSRTAADGHADRLNRMLTDYRFQKEAEKREALRLANAEAERIAREAEAVRLKAVQMVEEARLQAERARVAIHKQTKAEAAQQAALAESEAIVAAQVAAARAEEARIATLVSSADLMRTRTEDGTLGTTVQEKFADVTDRTTLDLEALRPYFSPQALQQALNGYAQSKGYSSDPSAQIKGANFGKRPKARVR
jgi:hypothetical protein